MLVQLAVHIFVLVAHNITINTGKYPGTGTPKYCNWELREIILRLKTIATVELYYCILTLSKQCS